MWMGWEKPESKQFFYVLIFHSHLGRTRERIATRMLMAVVQDGNVSTPPSGPALLVLVLIMTMCTGGAEQKGATSTWPLVLFLC